MHYLMKEYWTRGVTGIVHEVTILQKLCFDIYAMERIYTPIETLNQRYPFGENSLHCILLR